MESLKKNIILLGDGAVGKTSLTRRFTRDDFSDRYITTIGTKVTKKDVYLGEGKNRMEMELLLWDILGQKGYKYTQALSFGGIEGALLVSDLTRKDTLDSLRDYWIPSIVRVTGAIPMVFLGNKADLEDEVQFNLKELQELESEIATSGLMTRSFLTSAKTGDNVEKAFDILATSMRDITMKAKEDIARHMTEGKEFNTLVDVLDHIISDFCAQFGGTEVSTTIVKREMELARLDINNPEKKAIVSFVNGLSNAERTVRQPHEVELNRTKRLYLINII